MTERRHRSLTLTADLLRAYSRRGNFHADPDTAQELGLTELVAQGMQVAGPAYALLLDAWGEDWLARGELDLTFVAMVRAGETVDAEVELDGEQASLRVTGSPGVPRVVGRARRTAGRSGAEAALAGGPASGRRPDPAPGEARPELRVPRPDEAAPADEMAMARAWLTHLRESAIFKLEDLDSTQLRWRPTPTANSLGAIVMHLG